MPLRKLSAQHALQLAKLCHMVDGADRPLDEDRLNEFAENIEDTFALYLHLKEQERERPLPPLSKRRRILSKLQKALAEARPLFAGVDWFENGTRHVAHAVGAFPGIGRGSTKPADIANQWLCWNAVKLFNEYSGTQAKPPYHDQHKNDFVGEIVDFVEFIYSTLRPDRCPPSRMGLGQCLRLVMKPEYVPPFQMPELAPQ